MSYRKLLIEHTRSSEHYEKKAYISPKALGIAGATVGGVYGAMGDPTDPRGKANRKGFMRGAVHHGMQGLGAGLGAVLSKSSGLPIWLGMPLGLLAGGALGRGFIGPDRPRI